jgi:biopolymer transport protein ExbD
VPAFFVADVEHSGTFQGTLGSDRAMQASTARRAGLITVSIGVTLYAALGERTEFRLLFAAALLITLVGFLFLLFHSLQDVDRNLLEGSSSAGEARAFSGASGARVRRGQGKKTLSLLPHFPLVAVTGMMFVLIVFLTLRPLTPTGLWVYLSPSHLVKANADPAGAVIVRVTRDSRSSKRPVERVFVNDQEVGWENLRGALLSKFSARAEWVVFVEGDKDLPYQDIVDAMDIARDLRATVVMLTPRMAQATQSGDQAISNREASNPVEQIAAASPDFWNPKPVVAAKKPAAKKQPKAEGQ